MAPDFDATSMKSGIEFTSHVARSHRVTLEALMFFNSCQERVADCIAHAVDEFGYPEIVADGDRLRIRIGDVGNAQTLFAVEATTGRPVGVAVYARPDLEQITVMHLGIAAPYASGGAKSNEQLLLRLLREVRRSTRRMKGVQRLELYYVRGRGSRHAWRESAKALG
jgi:hypothetical protein